MTSPDGLPEIYRQLGELTGTLKGLHESFDRQGSQVSGMLDVMRNEMRDMKHDQGRIENAVGNVQNQIEAVARQAQDAASKAQQVADQIKQLKDPVEKAASNVPPTIGLLSAAVSIGATFMYFLAPVVRQVLLDLANHVAYRP